MKTFNGYANQLAGIYDKTPKAVIAAIAFSFAVMQTEGEDFGAARIVIEREWWTLYDNGIIPQKPPFPRPADAQ